MNSAVDVSATTSISQARCIYTHRIRTTTLYLVNVYNKLISKDYACNIFYWINYTVGIDLDKLANAIHSSLGLNLTYLG